VDRDDDDLQGHVGRLDPDQLGPVRRIGGWKLGRFTDTLVLRGLEQLDLVLETGHHVLGLEPPGEGAIDVAGERLALDPRGALEHPRLCIGRKDRQARLDLARNPVRRYRPVPAQEQAPAVGDPKPAIVGPEPVAVFRDRKPDALVDRHLGQ
jgi:hypothetical protein